MSFIIAFDPFVRLDVVDDSANGGERLEAFTFEPTKRTRQVMADYSIVFREGVNGFSLYYKSNLAISPPLLTPILARTRFSFKMTLTEGGFFDRFHPDFGGGKTQILLDNLDAAGAATSTGQLSVGATVETDDLIAMGPTNYPVRLDVSGGVPAVVEAQNRFDGTVVATTNITIEPSNLEVVTSLKIDADADAALRLVAPAPSTLDRLIYADDEIADSNAVGAVDFYWDQSQDTVPAGTGATFTAVFRRRP